MTLQAELNQQALDFLLDVSIIIDAAEPFEADQMRNRTLRAINMSKKPLEKMSICEIYEIQQMLIMSFRFHGWLAKEES